MINGEKFKVERVFAKGKNNPVAVVLFLLLNNIERRLKIETTSIIFNGERLPPEPKIIVERIKEWIVVKRCGTGFEYRFYSDQLACDIRVLSDTRRYEDWTVNNYK